MPNLTIRLARRSAFLETDSRAIHHLLVQVGCPKQFDPIRRCWSVPLAWTSDVAAAAEYARPRWRVTFIDTTNPTLDDALGGSA